MNAKLLILETNKKDFEKKFLNRIRINSSTNVKVQDFVDRAITDIKEKGDSSLVSYVNKYYLLCDFGIGINDYWTCLGFLSKIKNERKQDFLFSAD